MKNRILAACIALFAITTDVYSFKYGDLYYKIIGENEVEVTHEVYESELNYSKLKNVDIADSVTYNGKTYSVTSIGDDAFYGCSGLTSITIPNSVTNIGEYVFSGCSGLTSIVIPNSVTSISFCAFSGCSGLTSITIPNSVTKIGEYAFYYCSSLISITIPTNVTSIGDEAFRYCSGLKSVIWNAKKYTIYRPSDAPFYYVKNNRELYTSWQ